MSTNPDLAVEQLFNQNQTLIDRQMDQTQKLAELNGRIDGFMTAFSGMQSDINSDRANISGLDRRVTALEQEAATVRSYLKGIAAAVGVVWIGLTTFAWPWLKEKVGM